MDNHVCSCCGSAAYHDGRCGDGPVLVCGCDRPAIQVPDRFGFETIPANDARPIPAQEFIRKRRRADGDR